jgi:hypothetical protein
LEHPRGRWWNCRPGGAGRRLESRAGRHRAGRRTHRVGRPLGQSLDRRDQQRPDLDTELSAWPCSHTANDCSCKPHPLIVSSTRRPTRRNPAPAPQLFPDKTVARRVKATRAINERW